MSRFVLVTGATGKQGGAVAKHLLLKRIAVRALTRNSQGDAAKALSKQGADIAQGDLNDRSSLDAALQGVDAVFSVQDFWAKGVGYAGEIAQGKNLADAAKAAGVSHFVQSGMARGDDVQKIPHFMSKQIICDYVKQIGLPYTVMGTVYFMNNLLDQQRGGSMTFPVLSGTLKARTQLHMLAVDDLGTIVAKLISNPHAYIGRHIDIASDCLTVQQMRDIYAAKTGLTPKRWFLPHWALRLANNEFAKQLEWQNKPGWTFNTDQARALHPKLTSFGDFIERYRIHNL